MLNTKSITAPASLRPPLPPLNNFDTYSLSGTHKNRFQTDTNLNAFAILSRTLYQQYTAPDKSPSASLLSSSSVPTVNPISLPPVFAQTYTVHFVSVSKPVKPFYGLDHHYP